MTRQSAARIGRSMCLAGAALGALGFLGWAAGWPFLTTIVPGQPSMKPNTAVGLLLLGVAGAFCREDTGPIRRMLSVLAALVVLGIGVGTLAEYALAVDLEIDRVLLGLLRSADPGETYPGRPSPPTALALALLSAAIVLFDFRPTAKTRPSEWLILAALFTAFVALTGFFFGAGPLYRLSDAPVTGVAMPTGVSLVLLGAGLLLGRPHAGIMRVVLSSGPGGVMLRRLAVPGLLAPALLGPIAMRLPGTLGFADFPLIVATVAITMTMVTLLLLTLTAPLLNRTQEALQTSRTRLRELIEHASDGVFVADLDGRYTDVNSAGCRMLGFERQEMLRKTILDLIPPAEVERLAQEKKRLLDGQAVVSEWTLRHKDGSFVPVEVSAKILADGRWQGFVRDIRVRRQAEDQLRQSRERLELALRGADLAAWDWNVATGEVTFNSRWAEMRGFRPEEIEPRVESWVSAVHPEDLPRVQKTLADHFDERVAEYECEHRIRTKSGEWLWILDRGKVFARDAQGRPTRMVGTELDITPRKRLEEDLWLSLARSSGILAISADAIICIDDAQRITMFNDGAEQMFGYRKAEAIGQPLELLIPERFRGAHRGHVASFAVGAPTARRMGERGAHIVALRNSGEEFPADAAISKLEVGGKNVLTVAVRDVTEQRRIEREERFLGEVAAALGSTLDCTEALDRLAQLMVRDVAAVCIVTTVAEDGRLDVLRVAYRNSANAAATEALQQLAVDPRPLPASSIFGGGHAVLMEDVDQWRLDSTGIDEADRRVLGELRPDSLLAVPLAAHGRVLGAMVLVERARRLGPGELRLAEEVARRAATAVENAHLYRDALEATRARDELLGIVAHDLRNPLQAILMNAQLLRRAGGQPERRSLESSEAIERSAARMARLIDDLLDLTRMEAGRLSVARERVPVDKLVADCVAPQQALATSASLELRSSVASDVPDVWGDHDRLLQVLENLVGNAIKFTAPGGRITVGAARDGGDVRFWVADAGAGIPAEHLPHLFDRFWQAHTAERRGAGLGLPIAKGIVESHGGRLSVESNPGRGSTFSFSIPLALPEEQAVPN
ncbi:MAG TPA: PAS domain S-box protein [Woeseiaceae bacterium]